MGANGGFIKCEHLGDLSVTVAINSIQQEHVSVHRREGLYELENLFGGDFIEHRLLEFCINGIFQTYRFLVAPLMLTVVANGRVDEYST